LIKETKMPRERRLHKLEPAEHATVSENLRSVERTIRELYALVVERFGSSDRKAQRLQALERKLSEVNRLFIKQSEVDLMLNQGS
jgi:uncharacterized coiled-coil protein SlyX